MLTLTQRLPPNSNATAGLTLSLTAEERMRSRHYFDLGGQSVYLHLPRGTVLRHGDLLQSDAQQVVRITAKPEPVITVMAKSSLELLRAAYHLGNRHVPLEVKETYLRLSPDPVLQAMLEQLGLQIQTEIAPFQPESGAYGHSQEADSHFHEHH
jgi:urease accessory protein